MESTQDTPSQPVVVMDDCDAEEEKLLNLCDNLRNETIMLMAKPSEDMNEEEQLQMMRIQIKCMEEEHKKSMLLWETLLKKKGDQLVMVMRREEAVVGKLRQKLSDAELKIQYLISEIGKAEEAELELPKGRRLSEQNHGRVLEIQDRQDKLAKELRELHTWRMSDKPSDEPSWASWEREQKKLGNHVEDTYIPPIEQANELLTATSKLIAETARECCMQFRVSLSTIKEQITPLSRWFKEEVGKIVHHTSRFIPQSDVQAMLVNKKTYPVRSQPSLPREKRTPHRTETSVEKTESVASSPRSPECPLNSLVKFVETASVACGSNLPYKAPERNITRAGTKPTTTIPINTPEDSSMGSTMLTQQVSEILTEIEDPCRNISNLADVVFEDLQLDENYLIGVQQIISVLKESFEILVSRQTAAQSLPEPQQSSRVLNPEYEVEISVSTTVTDFPSLPIETSSPALLPDLLTPGPPAKSKRRISVMLPTKLNKNPSSTKHHGNINSNGEVSYDFNSNLDLSPLQSDIPAGFVNRDRCVDSIPGGDINTTEIEDTDGDMLVLNGGDVVGNVVMQEVPEVIRNLRETIIHLVTKSGQKAKRNLTQLTESFTWIEALYNESPPDLRDSLQDMLAMGKFKSVTCNKSTWTGPILHENTFEVSPSGVVSPMLYKFINPHSDKQVEFVVDPEWTYYLPQGILPPLLRKEPRKFYRDVGSPKEYKSGRQHREKLHHVKGAVPEQPPSSLRPKKPRSKPPSAALNEITKILKTHCGVPPTPPQAPPAARRTVSPRRSSSFLPRLGSHATRLSRLETPSGIIR